MGSGRASEGKLPSIAPATITVSNSRPAAPWAVSTCTASAPPASRAAHPGPCSPASSASRNPSTLASPVSAASLTRSENVTTVSSPEPPSATSRSEHGSSSQSVLNASCTAVPAQSSAFTSVACARSTAAASAGSRPSVRPRAAAAARGPSPVLFATRIRPRAAAGDSPTTSEVSSGSISSSRRAASATSQRSARMYGYVAASAVSDSPRSGTARGTRASSSARKRFPRCAPCRRTITAMSCQATPSPTWRRRSSRAIAACSSEVCGATHAAVAGGCGARCGVVSWTVVACRERLRREPSERDVGRPLEREHVRVGVRRHDQVGGRRARAAAPRPRSSCPGSRPPAGGRTGPGRRPPRPPRAAPAPRGPPAPPPRARRGTRRRTAPARSSRRRPDRSAAAVSSSGVRSPSCMRVSSCRTSSANPRTARRCPYAGHAAGSWASSSSRTRANCSAADSTCGGSPSALLHDLVRQPVQGQDLQARQRCRQSRQHRRPRSVPGPARPHHEHGALGRRPVFEQPRERLPEHPRLAGAGDACGEQRPVPVGQDRRLGRVGGERRDRHVPDATRQHRQRSG